MNDCPKLIHISFSSTAKIIDSTGKEWFFEEHPYCGPTVLNKIGEMKSRQPGRRSLFWESYKEWIKEKERNAAQNST